MFNTIVRPSIHPSVYPLSCTQGRRGGRESIQPTSANMNSETQSNSIKFMLSFISLNKLAIFKQITGETTLWEFCNETVS